MPPLLEVVPQARLNLAIHQAFSARSTAAALTLVQPLVAPVDLEEWLVKGAVLAAHADAVMQQPGGATSPLVQVRSSTSDLKRPVQQYTTIYTNLKCKLLV